MVCKKLLTFGRTLENDAYGIYDWLGFRLLNRLCVGFSNLKEHNAANIRLEEDALKTWRRLEDVFRLRL